MNHLEKRINSADLFRIDTLVERATEHFYFVPSVDVRDPQSLISLCMENSVREDRSRNYERACIFLNAALVTAYMFDLSGIGRGFYQKKSKKMDTQSLIVHYALKLSKALIKRKSDDIIDDYYYKLYDTTEEYIEHKGDKESSNGSGPFPLT